MKNQGKIGIYFLVILLLAGAIFISFKTFSNKYEIINAHKNDGRVQEEKTIVAFGDSLVLGFGSTEGNDFVSLLSKKVGEPILNLGKNGDTTETALTRIESATKANPDIVIILLGGNDYLRQVPQSQTFENLGRIVKTFQDNGAAVIILGVRGGVLKDTYEENFKNFAKDYGAAYVPNVLDELIGNTEFMSDAVHPNNAGYEKIAEKVQPVLEDLLK